MQERAAQTALGSEGLGSYFLKELSIWYHDLGQWDMRSAADKHCLWDQADLTAMLEDNVRQLSRALAGNQTDPPFRILETPD